MLTYTAVTTDRNYLPLTIDQMDVTSETRILPPAATVTIGMVERLLAPSDAKVIARNAGFNNCTYIVEFIDKFKLCIRIPACGWGNNWTEVDASQMRNSAFVLDFLRRTNSHFPVPKVFEVSASRNNGFLAPYTIMSFVGGHRAKDIWFNEDGDIPVEKKRQNILESLAFCLAQLRPMSYNAMGSIEPGEDAAAIPVIGPILNSNFGWLRHASTILEDKTVGPFKTSHEWLWSRYCEWFETSMKKTSLNPYLPGAVRLHTIEYHRIWGISRLYQLIIEHLPFSVETTSADDPSETFVIAPPDFDWQNIYCTKDGFVIGLIDWDRTETVPRYLGWACPPLFLCRDWTTNGVWAGDRSLTVEEMKKYRMDYAGYMNKACRGAGDCKYTPKGHYFDGIQAALGDDELMETVCHKILSEIFEGEDKAWIDDWILRFGMKSTDEQEESVRNGLQALLSC